MYTFAFIDFESITKTAWQDYGSVLVFDKLVNVIKEVATSNKSVLIGIHAYGDFDRGIPGLMSRLINLGIEPHHVVTKTAKEYLKGSTDIELSLDVLETMYNYPHITDYLFITGDCDFRYVISRLKKQGKYLSLMGFESNTSQYLIDIVNNYIPLNNYPDIMRKETSSEKEQRQSSLISNRFTKIVLSQLKKYEKEKSFVGLNYLRNKLIDYYQDTAAEISEVITECIDCGLIEVFLKDNPNDANHPTSACLINKNSSIVKIILNEL